MAKLHEEVLVIKVSKLVKDSEQASGLVTEETITSLEAVVQELTGPTTLVEIERA
jgi:phosphohistidine swiveling domain-containing protein